MESSIASQGLRLRAKMVTTGSNMDESSSVPSEMVTKPGIAVFRPRTGLPQDGQKTRVTSFSASDLSLYSRTGPRMLKRSIGNIAPVE